MAANSSRAQQVADEIEDELLTSGAPAGARIGLRTELIRRFEVSPSVMNEALRILRDRDLVTVKPGAHGGVFVANPAAQVRLGNLDLWFRQLRLDPKHLFEARVYLEDLFATVALTRATPEDIRAMQWALEEMRAVSGDPRSFLEATMRFHLAIARASRIEVLIGFYESIITVLGATLVRASYASDQHEEMMRHNLEVHANMAAAIRDQDAVALDKILVLHHRDLIWASDPSRSPHVDDE
ncbi:FadR/GntR family transcriptional regulator [Pseudonocardia asaccharolytica]|uniref:FadR/GntR family transcriptional regulator n=1 Tax=Pseudonocardia asaccharolytica TaxID=54010 RepID=UPI0004278FF3|nr:FCD domain-containing protein [Pseudonocardia asaccharolytica]